MLLLLLLLDPFSQKLGERIRESLLIEHSEISAVFVNYTLPDDR